MNANFVAIKAAVDGKVDRASFYTAKQTAPLTSNGSQGWQTVPGATVTLTLDTPGTLEIRAEGSVTGSRGTQPSAHCGYRVLVDGAAPAGQDPTWGDRIVGVGDGAAGAASGWWTNFSFSRSDSVAAGSHTITLQQNAWPGTNASCTLPLQSYAQAKLSVIAR